MTYVAVITYMKSDTIGVKYLRKSKDSRKFVYPKIDDLDECSLNDIIRKLNGIESQRGHVMFDEEVMVTS